MDSFAKTGNFERKYLDFSGISIPHWADVLLDILIDKYRITTQEAETGYELIIKYGLMIIPTIYVRSSLEGIAGTKQQKEDMGDHIDLMRLSTAIPSADIILTDKARVFDLKQLKFNEEFQVDIYSGAASDLTRFKLKLQEILQ